MLRQESSNTPVKSGQAAVAANVAEFDLADTVILSTRWRNFGCASGILIVLVGILGMVGHASNNHFLLSLLSGRREEIALSTSVALVLLGIAITQGVPLRCARWKGSNGFLLSSVIVIAGYNIFHYFQLAGFQFFLPLTQDFAEIPMAFLTAVQLLGVAMGLLVYNRFPHIWGVAVGFSIIVFWLLETALFSVLGYELHLPVLSSYVQSVPAVIAFFVAGISCLKALTRPEGLLSPLISPIRRIKLFTLASILMGILILVAGVAIIALFERLLIHGASTQASDQLFVSFELATVGLSILVLLLSLRVLFFYENSLQAQTQVSQLNAQLEQRVEERTAQLEQASRQKSKVLAMVSHDFKTPLAAVSRFVEILKGQGVKNMTEDQLELLDHIGTAIDQLRAMIREVLDRARVEEGRINVQPTSINIHTFVQELLPALHTLAEEKEVRLESDVNGSLEAIESDPIHLRQILVNLLSNAIKYNVPNGQVLLRIYRDENTGMNIFEVQDTGLGIPQEQQETIFKEYSRLAEHAQKAEGTGLGLANTKRLVELLGGKIAVFSQMGGGTTFIVKLPEKYPSFQPTRINKPT